jgi:hypothetical protein
MAKKIVINGITYRSFDEIPQDEREKFQGMLSRFADRNLNGIPDIFEDEELGQFVFSSDSKIIINDQEFSSVEQLPPFVRKAFETVFDLTDQDRDGKLGYRPVQTTTQDADDHPDWRTDMRPLKRASTPKPVQETVSTTSRFVTALIVITILAIIVIGFVLLFVR